MSAVTQHTPWQKLKCIEEQMANARNSAVEFKEKLKPKDGNGIVWAQPCRPCNPHLTYFNNGKVNKCCKTLYDYNFFFCEGYDQDRERCDMKHPYFYMNIDLEEEYPCRTIPILTSSHYGHRRPYDTFQRRPRVHMIRTFYRNGSNGAAHCINADANAYVYDKVRYQPTHPFMLNAQYGYTYAPSRN